MARPQAAGARAVAAPDAAIAFDLPGRLPGKIAHRVGGPECPYQITAMGIIPAQHGEVLRPFFFYRLNGAVDLPARLPLFIYKGGAEPERRCRRGSRHAGGTGTNDDQVEIENGHVRSPSLREPS